MGHSTVLGALLSNVPLPFLRLLMALKRFAWSNFARRRCLAAIILLECCGTGFILVSLCVCPSPFRLEQVVGVNVAGMRHRSRPTRSAAARFFLRDNMLCCVVVIIYYSTTLLLLLLHSASGVSFYYIVGHIIIILYIICNGFVYYIIAVLLTTTVHYSVLILGVVPYHSPSRAVSRTTMGTTVVNPTTIRFALYYHSSKSTHNNEDSRLFLHPATIRFALYYYSSKNGIMRMKCNGRTSLCVGVVVGRSVPSPVHQAVVYSRSGALPWRCFVLRSLR